MQKIKTIRLGIVGAGTVGRALIEIIRKEKQRILQNHGIQIEIQKVADRSYEKKEILRTLNCTHNIYEITDDPNIDIVVELMGGIESSYPFIIKSIENNKSIVTANKALLANYGQEIFQLLKEKQNQNIPITIGFEASVGAALPIIKNLRRIWSFGKIYSMVGILNGTCNFILTKMEEGQEYLDALKLAQEKGFAEADPTFDVSGRDATQKLAIISSLAFGTWVKEKDIPVEGIENIQKIDLEIAKKWDMVIRLVGMVKFVDQKLLLRVHPALIYKNHLLADVREEFNAIFIQEEYSGSTFIVGKGAGGYPTASAVLADIISIASGSRNLWFNNFNHYEKIHDALYKFYLRFQTVDRPGVLAAISGVLAQFQISIASMHQEEGEEPVNVVLFTHECKESSIEKALKIINEKKDIILAPTVAVRVLN